MSLKIVFALVFAAALGCAQTVATSSAGVPAKEAAAPIVPPPASPPETNQNPSGQSAGSETTRVPAPQAAPESPAAPAALSGEPGKAAMGGRQAGAKPDAGHKAYVIGPLDVLQIKVWKDVNLSGVYAVDSDGMISMPLVGEIKADGLTARQAKDKVSERLRDYFNNNPDVDVTVAKVNSKRYFVYGGVGRGGEYPLVQETTVMDALSNTGGFKDFANKKKIRIQRMLPSGVIKEFNFNYNDISKGKHMEDNILLENGDRIFVPE